MLEKGQILDCKISQKSKVDETGQFSHTVYRSLQYLYLLYHFLALCKIQISKLYEYDIISHFWQFHEPQNWRRHDTVPTVADNLKLVKQV